MGLKKKLLEYRRLGFHNLSINNSSALLLIFLAFNYEYLQYLAILDVLEQNKILNQENDNLLLALAQKKEQSFVLECITELAKRETAQHAIDWVEFASFFINLLLHFARNE